MKKYLKDIVLVVVTAVIASGVGVAAYNYNANNIEYSPSDKTWKVSTVAEAINSLVNDTRGSVMNYSLDEQVVGTWIDGENVYSRCFVLQNTKEIAIASWTTIYSESSLSNYKKIIYGDIQGANNTYYGSPYFKVTNNNLQIMLPSKALAFDSGTTFCIQYTKTTDTGNSNNG